MESESGLEYVHRSKSESSNSLYKNRIVPSYSRLKLNREQPEENLNVTRGLNYDVYNSTTKEK